MRLGRVAHGPLFRRVSRKNGGVTSERLTDKHVARLAQKTALAAGMRGDLSEGERKLTFSGHPLRAGLASPGANQGSACSAPSRPRQRRNDPPISKKGTNSVSISPRPQACDHWRGVLTAF